MVVFSGSDLTCLRGARLVFKGLSFNARPGDAIMLHGRNGAGKSSLLRLMAGLLQPQNGMISWNDLTIRDDMPAHRSRLRYIGHQDAIKPVLSVRDNLRLWSQLHDVQNLDEAIDHALEALDIVHLADTTGRYLSSGQKRRTALARILIGPSNLWLLDEPTVGLDYQSCANLSLQIANFRKKGGIVIYSTHIALDIEQPQKLDLDAFAVSPITKKLLDNANLSGPDLSDDDDELEDFLSGGVA